MVNHSRPPPRRLQVVDVTSAGDDEPLLEWDGPQDYVCGRCYRKVCCGVDPARLAGARLRCPSCGAVNQVPPP